MPTFTTADGTEIFYKDWGPKTAKPIVFHHGWPLSADDWDNQMLFFLSETDFTDDLKAIEVPTLVLHGDDDQIVPYADSAPLSAKLLARAELKTYPGFPHGMCTTHADVVNEDLLAFVGG